MANKIDSVHSNITYLGEKKIGAYDYDTPLECLTQTDSIITKFEAYVCDFGDLKSEHL